MNSTVCHCLGTGHDADCWMNRTQPIVKTTVTVDGSSDEQLFRRAVLAELRAIRELIQRAGYR